MNKAIIIGNLTKDPEVRTTQSGLSVCSFTVAVGRNFSKEKEDPDYIPVVTWRGLADNCGKYLTKGNKVAVSGRIQTRTYDDKDGNRRYATELVADDVEFLTPKGAGSGQRDFDAPPPPSESGLFEDERSDFEPLDDEQMPF